MAAMGATFTTDDLMSQLEASKLIGISPQAVHQAIRERRLAAIPIAGKVLVSRDAVERYRKEKREAHARLNARRAELVAKLHALIDSDTDDTQLKRPRKKK